MSTTDGDGGGDDGGGEMEDILRLIDSSGGVPNDDDKREWWIKILRPFVRNYEKHQSLKGKWTDDDKRRALAGLLPCLVATVATLSNNDDDADAAAAAAETKLAAVIVEVLRVISRDRTGIEALYEWDNVSAIIRAAGMFERRLALASSACTLFSNMAVLNRPLIYTSVQRFNTESVGGVRQFVDALWHATSGDDGGVSAKHQFICARVLFLLTLDDTLALQMITTCDVYGVVVRAIDHVVQQGRYTAAPPDGCQERRVLSEMLKVVFNLTMTPSHPTLQACVSVDDATRFGECVAMVLAANTTVPDLDATDAAYKAMLDARAPSNTPQKRQEVDVDKLDDGGGGGGDDDDEKKKGDKNGWRRCDPNRPDITYVKSDACNALMYQPNHLASVLDTRPAAVYGMCELLQRHARMPRRELGTYLVPVAVVVTGVVKASAAAKALVKRFIFRHLARPVMGPTVLPPPTAPSSSLSPEEEEQMQQQKKMRPEGTERELASDNALKYTLIGCLTAPEFTIRCAVEELLWQLANGESKEFIRMVGFGNAAGLLVNRGLPGFAHLKTSAVDIDQLVSDKNRKQ